MSIELNFIKQLTTSKAVKEEAEYITKKQIKESYNNLMNSPFLFGKSRQDCEKLEDKIKITFAYLSLIICLEEYSEDYEIKKDELRNMAKQILDSSNKYKETLREKNKLKCTYINPYRNLMVATGSSNLEILRGYERQLNVIAKIFDSELIKSSIDPHELIETYSTFLLQKQSYEVLNDKHQKRRIDEEILLNFNPNCSDLYFKNTVGELAYFPSDDDNVYKMKNKFGDLIMFQKIGTLGYGIARRDRTGFSYKDSTTLHNYKVVKKYDSLVENFSSEPENREFNIFSCLNISKLTSDSDYTSLHADILFSDYNLEEASIHNGGYVGDIICESNGKYDVYHYPEKLCACIEYSIKR